MDTNNSEEKITYMSEEEAAEMNRVADELARTPDVREEPIKRKAFRVFALIVAIVFFIAFALGLGVVGVFGSSFSDFLQGTFGQGSSRSMNSIIVPAPTQNNAGVDPIKPLSESQNNNSGQVIQNVQAAEPDSTQQSTGSGNNNVSNTTKPNLSVAQPTPAPTPNAKVITISIYGEEGDNYVILDKTEIEYTQGETVYDALKAAKDSAGILVATIGAGESVYVKGINNLFEFDNGPTSGWLYAVNGVSPSVSCGAYKLNGGDEIVWKYT
jgi:hypothetical protein